MSFTRVILALVLVWLAGCSSLPRDSGFEVQTVQSIGRQEPWQNRAISREVFSPEGASLIYVKLPQPIPKYWQQEMVDVARSYEVVEGGRKVRQPLYREVFRAVVLGKGAIQTYDAVVDGDEQGVRGFLIFAPLTEYARLFGQSLLILSSDGKWAMTTLGERIEFQGGFTPEKFDPAIRSKVTQVIRLEPGKDEYARLVLEKIATAFPQPFWLRGRNESYLGKLDIATVVAEFTSVEGATDRLISCTSLKLGPGSTVALPLVGALYAYQAVNALSKEDCLK